MDSISRNRKGDVDILTVKGNIPHADSPAFESALADAVENGSSLLVLDFSATAHVCSSALGALISAKRRIRRREGDIRIVVQSGEVERILKITLLDRVFMLFDNVDAAVRSFQVRGLENETP